MNERNDRRQEPSRWRKQHDEFIETPSTKTAGEFVWQRFDGPAIIDTLFDRNFIDGDMHAAVADYRNDLALAGIYRSPPSASYGRVPGGGDGNKAELAYVRVLNADGYLIAKLGHRSQGLVRTVANDEATMPKHNGKPYWHRAFRLAAGTLAHWRRLDPDAVRAERLRMIGLDRFSGGG